jgi:hypothetical protein
MDKSTERENNREDKLPYTRPELQVYGDLRQITKNMGNPVKTDNPSKSGTHLGGGRK